MRTYNKFMIFCLVFYINKTNIFLFLAKFAHLSLFRHFQTFFYHREWTASGREVTHLPYYNHCNVLGWKQRDLTNYSNYNIFHFCDFCTGVDFPASTCQFELHIFAIERIFYAILWTMHVQKCTKCHPLYYDYLPTQSCPVYPQLI